MRGVDLAGGETALEVAASHEQSLAVGGLADAQGEGGYLTAAGRDPGEVVAGKDLKVVLADLLAAPGHIGLLLVGHHLGGQHLSIVIGAAHIDGILIGIMATQDGATRQTSIDIGANPNVVYQKIENPRNRATLVKYIHFFRVATVPINHYPGRYIFFSHYLGGRFGWKASEASRDFNCQVNWQISMVL